MQICESQLICSHRFKKTLLCVAAFLWSISGEWRVRGFIPFKTFFKMMQTRLIQFEIFTLCICKKKSCVHADDVVLFQLCSCNNVLQTSLKMSFENLPSAAAHEPLTHLSRANLSYFGMPQTSRIMRVPSSCLVLLDFLFLKNPVKPKIQSGALMVWSLEHK